MATHDWSCGGVEWALNVSGVDANWQSLYARRISQLSV